MSTEKKELVVRGFAKDQVDLVKRIYAVGATDDELKLYFYQCKRTGLDPLSGQLYFIKRGGKMTLQTGIDGLRSIAEQSGCYAGNADARFEIDPETKLPVAATVTVYKIVQGEKVEFTATARWKEYKPVPPNDFMWRKMPFGQLGKCAEALALRKAFPKRLGKLYADEEMQQARNGEPIAEPKALKEKGVTEPEGDKGEVEGGQGKEIKPEVIPSSQPSKENPPETKEKRGPGRPKNQPDKINLAAYLDEKGMRKGEATEVKRCAGPECPNKGNNQPCGKATGLCIVCLRRASGKFN